LKHVFENWLKRDPALHGQLKIKFTILPSGEVSNVSIVSSTMNNSEFDENIVRYIKRWAFPPVEGGGPVEVTFPFVFEGQPS
jgi:TonB family protein